jgi:hypothetical protein
MNVFWDIAPCSLAEVDWRFRGSYCVRHQGNDYGPKDGQSTNLWNVGLVQRDNTALYPRRLPSLYSMPWEPPISLMYYWFLWRRTEMSLSFTFQFLFRWTRAYSSTVTAVYSHEHVELASSENTIDSLWWSARGKSRIPGFMHTALETDFISKYFFIK